MSKLDDIFADLRLDPTILGEEMSRSQYELQKRAMEFCVSFIRSLSIQDQTGGYINGNMELATAARNMYILLTENGMKV